MSQTASEQTIASLLFRGLARVDSDGRPQPDLAESWSVSADGLRYDVQIDTSQQWHDGEQVTADDVVFTVSMIQDPEFPGDPSLARFWRGITATKTADDAVRFELHEPFSGFLNYLTFPVLPKHVLEGTLPVDFQSGELNWQAIGTGPYELDEIDEKTGELHFKVAESSETDPYLSRVTFSYFETYGAALNAFRMGDVDGIHYLRPESVLETEQFPGGSRIYAPSLSGHTALYFNLRHPTFRDVATRRAIELALDRQAIVERALGGQGIAGDSPIPEMLSPHAPGNHGGYDPGRARELLEETGWTSSGSSTAVRQRNGERFVVPVLVDQDDPQRMSVASMIRDQLRQVGVQVEIRAVSAGELRSALDARQFAAALYGWHTETGHPDCYQLWHSSQAESGANFTGFVNAEADEALLSARRATDLTERDRHYEAFQRVFAEQAPAVVLYYPRYHFAVSARVAGAEPHPLVDPADRVRQITEWYITETS